MESQESRRYNRSGQPSQVKPLTGVLEGLKGKELLDALNRQFQPADKVEVIKVGNPIKGPSAKRRRGLIGEYLVREGVFSISKRPKVFHGTWSFNYTCLTPGHGSFENGRFTVHARFYHPEEYEEAVRYAEERL